MSPKDRLSEASAALALLPFLWFLPASSASWDLIASDPLSELGAALAVPPKRTVVAVTAAATAAMTAGRAARRKRDLLMPEDSPKTMIAPKVAARFGSEKIPKREPFSQ